jgi:hypothetical protein
MIAPLLVALALADSLDVPAPPAAHQDSPTGWRHEAGLGAHSTTFSSKEGVDYTFHSASLGYLGSVGALGGFLHLFLLLPLQARQDGDAFSTANYYRHRWGGDLLVGAQRRWAVGTAEVEAGPGLHATALYLTGKPGYRTFSALPMGLGASATVRWKTRAAWLSRAVTFGAYGSAAYDFRDYAHADDLTHGLTFRLGLAVGLGARQ